MKYRVSWGGWRGGGGHVCEGKFTHDLFLTWKSYAIFSQSVSLTQYVVLSICLSACLSVTVNYIDVAQFCQSSYD